MLSRPGRACNGWRGWGSVRPRRLANRLNLGLEVLEPRLLMDSSPMYLGERFRAPGTRFRADWTSSVVGRPAEVAPGPMPANEIAGQETSSPDYSSGPPVPGFYLVVPETLDFHRTLPTAQKIPTVSYAGVTGTLSANDTIDLYRVDNVQGTLALRLAVAYDQDSLRLSIFNERGKVIAVDTTSNGVLDLSVSPDQLGPGVGSTLFVGVDSPNPAVALTGVNYQLWFLRLSETVGSSSDSIGEGSAPRGEIAGAVALMPSGSIPTLPGNGMSSGGGVLNGPTLLASAQSPALAAAPAAGLLNGGAPSLIVAMATRTGNDLERATALTRGAEPSPPNFEGMASQADDTAASSPLVALRGPGGFPVLAAAAVGDWQRGRDEPKDPAGDGHRSELANSPEPDASPAALPVIIAAAASSTRVNEPADRDANAPGTGYATLAVGYALSVDHAQFIDLVGRRPTRFRSWLWPRDWNIEKRRRTGRPRV